MSLFRIAFASLGRLKRTRTFLSDLSEVLQDDIATLENAILPASRAYGITSLPPEILQSIFIYVVKSCEETRRATIAISLAHVCRRFREAALSTRELWSYINFDDDPDYVAQKLELCGGEIQLYEKLSRAIQNPDDFGIRGVPYEEVRSLILDARFGYQREETDIADVMLEFEQIEFPSLETMIFVYDRVDIAFDLSFPSIASLVTNCMDYRFKAHPALTRLVIGEQVVRGIGTEITGSIRNLLKELGNHPALEDIHIELNTENFPGIRGDSGSRKITNLPFLRALNLSVMEAEDPYLMPSWPVYKCLLWTLQRIAAPALSFVHIKAISRAMGENIWGAAPELGSFPSAQSCVKTLIFESRVLDGLLFELDATSYREDAIRNTQTVVESLAKGMPDVEHLTMILPGLHPPTDRIPMYFPKLRTVHLEGWDDDPSARIALFRFMNQEFGDYLQNVTLVSQGLGNCPSESDQTREAAPDVVVLERNSEGDDFTCTWKHRFGYIDRAEDMIKEDY